MSIKFMDPQFLWLLSLLSVVIILHLIRPKRILVPVSTLLLWEKILKENPTGKWFKKLPKSLLLYLQVLTLILLVLSLAQPQLTFKGDINLPLVLIIDCSASTAARDILPSRFESIKKEALSLLSKIPFWKPVALIIAGSKPEIVSSFTLNHNLVEKRVKDLKVLYTKNTLQEAINLSESLLPNTPKDIHIFTDGNSFFSYPSNSINNYYVHLFGKGGENVGITNAKILPKNKRTSELFIEVSNFSNKVKSFTLEIWREGKILTQKDLNLNPKEIRKIILDIPYNGEKIEARLNIKDQLMEDNVAYLYLPILQPKILLISPGNPFLEKALRIVPNSYVDVKREIIQEDFIDYDFIVFDRLIPQYVPPGKYMFIGFSPSNFNFEVLGKLSKVKIVSWEDIPIMNLVQPLNVNIESSLLVKSQDLKPILYCEKGPIGFLYDKNDIFAVIVAFSILDSNWYYYDSFPIFIYNIINYALSYDPQRRPGEPIIIKESSPWIFIETPGEKKEMENKLGLIEFSNNFKLGFYTIKSRTKERIFTVNIFSKEESDIRPKLKVENLINIKTKEKGIINLSLAPYFLALAFLFLFLEIIIFLGGLKIK
ncbi:MAG: vWA domain-containing protein [Dictyoglomaceae bacterium]